jgi:hypothetical protein
MFRLKRVPSKAEEEFASCSENEWLLSPMAKTAGLRMISEWLGRRADHVFGPRHKSAPPSQLCLEWSVFRWAPVAPAAGWGMIRDGHARAGEWLADHNRWSLASSP